MTRFLTLILQPIKKSRFSLKRRSTFRTGAKIYLNEKSIMGLGAKQNPKKMDKKSKYNGSKIVTFYAREP